MNKVSLRARIFIILLVMSEILAIVLSIAMVFNYNEAIKVYYGNVGSNICNQIISYIDVEKLRNDFNDENESEELEEINTMLQEFVEHYSLHDISIFALNENYVVYIADTNRHSYYELDFNNLQNEQNRVKNAQSKVISIFDELETVNIKNEDGTNSKEYIDKSIASYIVPLGNVKEYPPFYLNINFEVDVIHNQIKDFTISIIAFCTLALIFEGLIIFIYLRYLVIDPLNQFSNTLDKVETDKDLIKLDLSQIDISSMEMNNFKNEVSNVINKFDQYSELLNESIVENRKSQYAIKTLSSFVEERGLPTSFYDDNNHYYTLCGMLNSVNNRVNRNFYDNFMIDDHRLCILVLENNQESMASILFMDMLRNKIKQDTMGGMTIDCIFTNLSSFMLDIDWVGIGINAYEAIIDLSTGEVEYVVAGDIYSAIFVDKGVYKKYVDVPHIIMPKFSVKKNAIFSSNRFTLLKNEKLFIYTSDLIDILNFNSGRFGKEVLLHYLNDNIDEDTDKLYYNLIDEIDKCRKTNTNCDKDCAFILFDFKNCIGDIDADLS